MKNGLRTYDLGSSVHLTPDKQTVELGLPSPAIGRHTPCRTTDNVGRGEIIHARPPMADGASFVRSGVAELTGELRSSHDSSICLGVGTVPGAVVGWTAASHLSGQLDMAHE